MEETYRILMRALDLSDTEARGFMAGWNSERNDTAGMVAPYTRGWIAGCAAVAVLRGEMQTNHLPQSER